MKTRHLIKYLLDLDMDAEVRILVTAELFGQQVDGQQILEEASICEDPGRFLTFAVDGQRMQDLDYTKLPEDPEPKKEPDNSKAEQPKEASAEAPF